MKHSVLLNVMILQYLIGLTLHVNKSVHYIYLIIHNNVYKFVIKLTIIKFKIIVY